MKKEEEEINRKEAKKVTIFCRNIR